MLNYTLLNNFNLKKYGQITYEKYKITPNFCNR